MHVIPLMILRELNHVHILTLIFYNVCILFFSLGLSLSNSLLTSGSLTTNPCVILIPPTRASRFISLNLPYLRTREMFTEKPRLRSFSFQSVGHTPVLFSPSGTNIRLSATIPKVLSSTLRTRTDHYRFKVTWTPSRLRFYVKLLQMVMAHTDF